MKQAFIYKDLNYAASKGSATADTATTPDTLADGAVGIYKIGTNQKLALVAATGGTIADNDTIIVAVGTAEGCYTSIPFKKKEATRRKDTYTAGTKKVFTISSITLPSTKTKYDEYGVTIVDMNRPDVYNKKWRFSAVGIYANAAAVVDELVAQINASDVPVVASKSTSDLVLTAENVGYEFEVLHYELLEDATLTLTTETVFPVGTPAKVLEYEKASRHYAQGTYSDIYTYDQPKAPSQVNGSGTYNVHFVDVMKAFESADAMDSLDTQGSQLILCFISADANGSEAEVETLI